MFSYFHLSLAVCSLGPIFQTTCAYFLRPTGALISGKCHREHHSSNVLPAHSLFTAELSPLPWIINHIGISRHLRLKNGNKMEIYIYKKNNEIHITFAQYQQLLYPLFSVSLSFLQFFLYFVCSFYLVLHLTNFRTLNKMLVINQSCHSKNTHRFIIGLALHFYSFFFYHPPSSSQSLCSYNTEYAETTHTHIL